MSPSRRLALVVVLYLVLGGTATLAATSAGNETFVSAVRSGQPIEPFVEQLDDADARYDIHDVSVGEASARFRYGVTASRRSRWYRFRLPPELESSGPWVLRARMASATLYEPTRFGYRGESFGVQTPVAERRLQNGLPDVDIRHEDYGRILYLRLEGPPELVSRFETSRDIERRVQSDDIKGIFFGVLYGSLAVSALAFGVITRSRAFLYYSLYIGMQSFNQLDDLPFLARNWWPEYAVTPWIVDVTFDFVALLAFMQFIRYALETRTSKTIDRAVVSVGLIATAAACYCALSDDLSGTKLLDGVLPFVLGIAFVVNGGVAFVRWRQRFVSAGVYLIGILGWIVGVVAYPFVPARIDSLDLGFTFEALAFLSAMAFRIVAITNERERALLETVAAREAVAEESARRTAASEMFNEAFARFVPREFLVQLGRSDIRDVSLGDHVERDMAVMFCDIHGFVALSERMSPEAIFRFLNMYFGRIGPIVRKYHGFIDKYLGDGVMALFPGEADGALQAAIELHAEVRRLNEARAREGEPIVDIGVGIHYGPLMLATVGERERYDTTVIADVVNIAARLEGVTNVYGTRILVSEAVLGQARDPGAFNRRWLGRVVLQGASLPLSTFEICDGDPAPLLLHKRSTAKAFEDALDAYRSGNYATSRMLFEELVRVGKDDRVASYFMERSRQRLAVVDGAWDGIERHESKR